MGFSRSFKSDYTYAYKYNDKYKYDRNKRYKRLFYIKSFLYNVYN